MTVRNFNWGCFAALAAAVALLAGCSPQQKPVADVLAHVGTRDITVADFNKEVQWRLKTNRPIPDRQNLLEEMIAREILIQKAEAAGLDKDFEIRHAYGDSLAGKVKDVELIPRLNEVKISPEEIKALYQQNIAHYSQPAKIRLALIYIKTDRKTSAEKLAEIQSRMTKIHDLAKDLPATARGFDRLAMENSEDQASRYRGGDVGWFDEGKTGYHWPASVIAAGFALENKGAMSDVIQAADGFYLVKKLDSRPPTVMPLERVEDSLKRRLLAEKRQQTQEEFMQQLRASIPVQTDAALLSKVECPTSAMARVEPAAPPSLPTQ